MTPPAINIIEAFFNQYPLKRYRKGQLFMLPGDTTEHAYYLVKGKMKVYSVSYKGDEVILNSFKEPAFFPLSLVINKSKAHFFHEADSDICVRRAPVVDAMKFLDRHPEVVLDLLSQLHKRTDSMLERMVHLMTSSANGRLVYELILACRQFGIVKDDGSYRVTISEKDLGARAGLTRETVSREAKTLKKKSLLRIHRGYMVIPDITKLESYLDAHT
jgi:CRP-like cAMP-binding protein